LDDSFFWTIRDNASLLSNDSRLIALRDLHLSTIGSQHVESPPWSRNYKKRISYAFIYQIGKVALSHARLVLFAPLVTTIERCSTFVGARAKTILIPKQHFSGDPPNGFTRYFSKCCAIINRVYCIRREFSWSRNFFSSSIKRWTKANMSRTWRTRKELYLTIYTRVILRFRIILYQWQI